MVGEKGVEPSRLAAHAPKACVSAISPLPHNYLFLKEIITVHIYNFH